MEIPTIKYGGLNYPFIASINKPTSNDTFIFHTKDLTNSGGMKQQIYFSFSDKPDEVAHIDYIYHGDSGDKLCYAYLKDNNYLIVFNVDENKIKETYIVQSISIMSLCQDVNKIKVCEGFYAYVRLNSDEERKLVTLWVHSIDEDQYGTKMITCDFVEEDGFIAHIKIPYYYL